jgi:hypothetical protein
LIPTLLSGNQRGRGIGVGVGEAEVWEAGVWRGRGEQILKLLSIVVGRD